MAVAPIAIAMPEWDVELPASCGAVTRLRVVSDGFAIVPDDDGTMIPTVSHGNHALGADQPDLPFLVRLIPIPRGCAAQLQLVELTSVETNSPPIRPVARQEAREDDQGRRSVALLSGERGPIYSQDAFWPPEALSISYAAQGTQRWARIVFHPLQYNPVRGILRWNKSIEARLHWHASSLPHESGDK